MSAAPFRNVCDTALWVAMYRALESERPDALFHDPFARRMAGERGEAIVRGLPLADSMAWAVVVRTALIDEIILQCVARGAGTVVNLGAGLDARAYRLTLPRKLRWFDVDLPDMIAYRRHCLGGETAACDHFEVAADICADAALARAFAAGHPVARGPVLVVSEGLLVYLGSEAVEKLGRSLRTDLRAHWWLTDLISPLAVNLISMFWQSSFKAAGAALRFAPPDSKAFFARLGWQELENRAIWQESVRLGRSTPLVEWWSALGKIAPFVPPGLVRTSGVSLFQRVAIEGKPRT